LFLKLPFLRRKVYNVRMVFKPFAGLVAVILLAACSQPVSPVGLTPTNVLPTLLPASPTILTAPPPTETIPPTAIPSAALTLPTALPTRSQPRLVPEETILILMPGPGSRLSNPVRISGMASSTFEQALVARIVTADGRELAIAPVLIDAELGQRGPFSVDMAISVEETTQAFIQVYSTSPRDGGFTHLASVGVTLFLEGLEVKPPASYLEHILIDFPRSGGTVSGGRAHVEGFALASFENTLVVDVVCPDGTVCGRQSVIVNAPELGEPGPFAIDVPYSLSAAETGRILVRDPSPAFDGDYHIASVEINLEP
jgi:hypothetical protein